MAANNNVPDIWTKSFKKQLKNGFRGGFILGTVLFLLNWVNNSIEYAILVGGGIWVCPFLIWIIITFLANDFFGRMIQIKKLTSKKYAFLSEKGFQIQEEYLYFTGTYKEYYFRIFPMKIIRKTKKNIDYIIIETYYEFSEPEKDQSEKENILSGDYFYGKIFFQDGCVGFVPNDYSNPDWETDLNALVTLCQREKLVPRDLYEIENISE